MQVWYLAETKSGIPALRRPASDSEETSHPKP